MTAYQQKKVFRVTSETDKRTQRIEQPNIVNILRLVRLDGFEFDSAVRFGQTTCNVTKIGRRERFYCHEHRVFYYLGNTSYPATANKNGKLQWNLPVWILL